MSDREQPAMVFAVRLWQEHTDDGLEYRGTVRDVVSGAFAGFRSWPDLTGFMVERMQEGARLAQAEGGA